MTQDGRDVALVIALGALMLGSCAAVWAIQHGPCEPEPEPEPAPVMEVSDKTLGGSDG